jgi:hypothetical protein
MKFFLVLFLSVWVFADEFADAATGEFAFLERYRSTREIALGNGASALLSGTENTFTNPAGLALLEQQTASFQYNYSLASEHWGWLNYAWKNDSLRMAISLAYADLGEVEEWNTEGEKTGTIHQPGNLVWGLHAAYPWKNTLYLGSSWRFISENLAQTDDSQTALGWSTDWSILWQSSIKDLLFAASWNNIGRKEIAHIKGGDKGWTNDEIRLGITMRTIGFSRLQLALDFVSPRNHFSYLNFGGELRLSRYLYLRGGLQRNYREIQDYWQRYFHGTESSKPATHFSLWQTGFAIHLNQIKLDYALEYLRYSIGMQHQIGVQWMF